MTLEEIYNMMKLLRRQMYENGKDIVELNQHEFFALYQTICYMMQIKHITDAQ